MVRTTKFAAIILTASALISGVNAQQKPDKNKPQPTASTLPKVALKVDATPAELAAAAIAAHGGDKFKKMQTLVMSGAVDVTSSSFNQALAGSFAIVLKNENYRLQINTPFFAFIQTFDGQNTSSSVGNVQIPPINRLGLPLLAKSQQSGYKIEALADKKKRGFRVTSPEGYATDFVLDDKTAQVKSYSATYEVNGRSVSTVVEHDKFREVEGVLLPEKYSQRFDAAGQTFYADFKVKEIKVNSAINDDVFKAAPQQ